MYPFSDYNCNKIYSGSFFRQWNVHFSLQMYQQCYRVLYTEKCYLCTYFQHSGIQIPQYSSYSTTGIYNIHICTANALHAARFLIIILIRLILFDVTVVPTSQFVLQMVPLYFCSISLQITSAKSLVDNLVYQPKFGRL